MHSFVAEKEALRVGSVIAVSPEDIEVQLEADAPDSIALNAGATQAFPRINGYLLIPNEVGFTVGQVAWIKIVNSPYSNRHDFKDVGLINLPFSRRIVSLSPLGTLKYGEDWEEHQEHFAFLRGVDTFPSVGDAVLLPTEPQLTAIVTAGNNLRVKIGTSPLAANVDVKIDPDRLFGRHLAVLGNTGSGKSCSVAGLIRWSLEAARQELKHGRDAANARFVVFDPNGEYRQAFADMHPTVLSVSPSGGQDQLQLPIWFWNSEEWFSFSRAGEKAHQPLLRRALREIRHAGGMVIEDNNQKLRVHLSRIYVKLLDICATSAYDGYKSGPVLAAFLKDFECYADSYSTFKEKIEALASLTAALLNKSRYVTKAGAVGYNAFSSTELAKLSEDIKCLLNEIGGVVDVLEMDEDIPMPFDTSLFISHLESISEEAGNVQLFGYFLARIKMALSDSKAKQVLSCGSEVTLATWLEQILGTSAQSRLTIVDFSLIPPHLLHVLTAVMSRMLFEALQRHRRVLQRNLPTVLVLEEAHNFIKWYSETDETPLPSQICCQTFEKIAKEGRKFGLGLVLSSQRPSELSPTVLSQCNSFLLHRITNDRDQDLLRRLLPDNMQGLLRELPTLPARNAILLGWASELPTLVRMDELAPDYQPQSQDPHFWDVWTRKDDSKTNWQSVADDWVSPNISSRNASTESPSAKVSPSK